MAVRPYAQATAGIARMHASLSGLGDRFDPFLNAALQFMNTNEPVLGGGVGVLLEQRTRSPSTSGIATRRSLPEVLRRRSTRATRTRSTKRAWGSEYDSDSVFRRQMQPRFVTARLRLTPAGDEDVDALWALWTEPLVRQFLWDDVVIERDRARDTVRESAALASQGLGLWTISLATDGTLVGCAALSPVGSAAEYLPAVCRRHRTADRALARALGPRVRARSPHHSDRVRHPSLNRLTTTPRG
jgi:hypothetical protein